MFLIDRNCWLWWQSSGLITVSDILNPLPARFNTIETPVVGGMPHACGTRSRSFD